MGATLGRVWSRGMSTTGRMSLGGFVALAAGLESRESFGMAFWTTPDGADGVCTRLEIVSISCKSDKVCH